MSYTAVTWQRLKAHFFIRPLYKQKAIAKTIQSVRLMSATAQTVCRLFYIELTSLAAPIRDLGAKPSQIFGFQNWLDYTIQTRNEQHPNAKTVVHIA